MSKVKYGLKNVHYAVGTVATNGTITYGEPVEFPGAVSMSLDAQGERSVFYADDVEYYVTQNNQGYQGDLEVALVVDDFHKDVLGEFEDAKKVFLEDADAPTVYFALMGEFTEDVKAKRWCLYKCTASRPSTAGQTKGETVEPQTETVQITASPVYDSVTKKRIVKASTYASTDATVYENWYESVYTPTAPTP